MVNPPSASELLTYIANQTKKPEDRAYADLARTIESMELNQKYMLEEMKKQTTILSSILAAVNVEPLKQPTVAK